MAEPEYSNPTVIPRDDHNISRKNISPNAVKVLYRLAKAGFQAYLVGGAVRDLLLALSPKDFDVATDATPEQVRSLFKNCRLIGRRFRLAHVHYGREIIEVATFRAAHDNGNDGKTLASGQIVRDNVYGNLSEDAWRRDFTINALYYDITDFSVIDHIGAMAHIKSKSLVLIGDAEQRYREDPVRMLRAVRFSAKLKFSIADDSLKPIDSLASLLQDVPQARLFDETIKLLLSGYGEEAFYVLSETGLFEQLFPLTEESLINHGEAAEDFVIAAFSNTDLRISQGLSINPAFIFASLLWQPVQDQINSTAHEDLDAYTSMQQAANFVLAEQAKVVAIPKRFSLVMREIWSLQIRFNNQRGKRPLQLLRHPRFRAAYDFMLLRAKVGEVDSELASWWTDFVATNQTSNPNRSKRTFKRRSNHDHQATDSIEQG